MIDEDTRRRTRGQQFYNVSKVYAGYVIAYSLLLDILYIRGGLSLSRPIMRISS